MMLAFLIAAAVFCGVVLLLMREIRRSPGEPAKQAERALAPGDGEAEPGGNGYQFQRACEAGDRLSRNEKS